MGMSFLFFRWENWGSESISEITLRESQQVVMVLERKTHLFWFTVPLFLHWMLSPFGEHLHPTLLNLPWYFHSLHWDLGFHPRECINLANVLFADHSGTENIKRLLTLAHPLGWRPGDKGVKWNWWGAPRPLQTSQCQRRTSYRFHLSFKISPNWGKASGARP